MQLSDLFLIAELIREQTDDSPALRERLTYGFACALSPRVNGFDRDAFVRLCHEEPADPSIGRWHKITVH